MKRSVGHGCRSHELNNTNSCVCLGCVDQEDPRSVMFRQAMVAHETSLPRVFRVQAAWTSAAGYTGELAVNGDLTPRWIYRAYLFCVLRLLVSVLCRIWWQAQV